MRLKMAFVLCASLLLCGCEEYGHTDEYTSEMLRLTVGTASSDAYEDHRSESAAASTADSAGSPDASVPSISESGNVSELSSTVQTTGSEVSGLGSSSPASIPDEDPASSNESSELEPSVSPYEYEGTVFVSSSGTSRRYHKEPDCSNMSGVTGMTARDALVKGYTPCKKCW